MTPSIATNWKYLFTAFLLLISFNVKAFTNIKSIKIFAVNKRMKFAVAMEEKSLVKPGAYTQYTLLDPIDFVPFQEMLKTVPKELKRKKRRRSIGLYLLTEIHFEKGAVVAFAMNERFRVQYNGYNTKISGYEFVKKCLEPFISPALNWHPYEIKELDLEPRRIKKEFLNADEEFDGFVLEFKKETLQFVKSKATRQQYFSAEAYDKAFGLLNEYILIGINLKTQRVVSIDFAGQEEAYLKNGNMTQTLLKRYTNIIKEQVKIKHYINPYRLQSDIIYRILEFED